VKFDRYPSKAPREITPRRVAAAARAVRREADAMPLFPELRRFTSTEERLDQMQAAGAAAIGDMRDFQAQSWRKARAILRREMRPTQAAGIVSYWQGGWSGPRTGTYLLGMIRDARRGKCFWRVQSYHRRLRLFQLGRAPWPNPKHYE